jgi:hypothetical protein
MSQVIIYQNPSAPNVVVCYPTGELPIEQVLTKDCPSGAVIVDSSILPTGAYTQFFDSWRWNGTTITVDFPSAQATKLAQYNAFAVAVANKRNLNTLSGIANTISDADWLAKLNADRTAIASATTTEQLVEIANPS